MIMFMSIPNIAAHSVAVAFSCGSWMLAASKASIFSGLVWAITSSISWGSKKGMLAMLSCLVALFITGMFAK
jgi:hypothetical protein